jgi:thiol-disulfide isomerase/thioredoxin
MVSRALPPPFRSGRWRAALVGGAALLTLIAGCGASSSDGSEVTGGPTTGAAPAAGGGAADQTATSATPSPSTPDGVRLTGFDGGTVTLADYRGRPLVVNFFASWCAPCVREMPEVEQVHQAIGDQVAFLGVNVRDRADDGRRLAEQTAVTFDLARDPRGDLLAAVGGKAMPTTAFIDRDGRVALVQSRAYTAESLRAAIDETIPPGPPVSGPTVSR